MRIIHQFSDKVYLNGNERSAVIGVLLIFYPTTSADRTMLARNLLKLSTISLLLAAGTSVQGQTPLTSNHSISIQIHLSVYVGEDIGGDEPLPDSADLIQSHCGDNLSTRDGSSTRTRSDGCLVNASNFSITQTESAYLITHQPI